jgi:hypothetical protein
VAGGEKIKSQKNKTRSGEKKTWEGGGENKVAKEN